jgi:predicted nucleic-acid-binding Zn-ribbon protein
MSEKRKIEITEDTKLLHICENCGKEEWLTSEEGFLQGWDYPPRLGTFGVVSPRNCGNCGITDTLWWEMSMKGTPISKLSEKQLKTLWRILDEPDSIVE